MRAPAPPTVPQAVALLLGTIAASALAMLYFGDVANPTALVPVLAVILAIYSAWFDLDPRRRAPPAGPEDWVADGAGYVDAYDPHVRTYSPLGNWPIYPEQDPLDGYDPEPEVDDDSYDEYQEWEHDALWDHTDRPA